MYNIYNDYEVYIGYIQLSEEVLQKYHPRVADPRVIFLQNIRGQLYISYIHQIIIIYMIFIMIIYSYSSFTHPLLLLFFWRLSAHAHNHCLHVPSFASLGSCFFVFFVVCILFDQWLSVKKVKSS